MFVALFYCITYAFAWWELCLVSFQMQLVLCRWMDGFKALKIVIWHATFNLYSQNDLQIRQKTTMTKQTGIITFNSFAQIDESHLFVLAVTLISNKDTERRFYNILLVGTRRMFAHEK